MALLNAIPLGENGALRATKTSTGKFLRHWIRWAPLAVLQVTSLRATGYEITSFQDLGTIGNAIGGTYAEDINDEGVIVGKAFTGTGAVRALMRFAGGPTINITPTGMVSASAEAINANNDVLGNGTSVFVRKADGTFYLIPPKSGATETTGSDINDERLVVGTMRINRINYAFFAEGTKLVDLNSLAAPFLAQPGQPGIFRLESAVAINNSNQIACIGR